MPKHDKISNSVIRRLPRYYRFLGELLKDGITKISSRELSERMRLTASQIRQDLNCFGGFGQQGYGYNVAELRGEIAKIIGVENPIEAVLIGAGNLGHAIAVHIDFKKNGCVLSGVFDNNPELTGSELAGVRVGQMDELAAFCLAHKPGIAILCIPKSAAKEVCETLIGLGVTGFWNFSHFDLNLHFDGIIVENVHLGDSMLTLAYNVNNNNSGNKPDEPEGAIDT